MPQLTNLIAHTGGYPYTFSALNKLLSLQAGAKRRLEIHLDDFCGWPARPKDWTRLSPFLEAADGFQHIHVSGEYTEGWFRIWTGSVATTWEDAEFCLFGEWNRCDPKRGGRTKPLSSRFIEVCGMLGVARVRRLVVNLLCKGRKNDLSVSYWWDLLEKLPGIEELELNPTGVVASGGDVWKVSTVPAVLPALRRVWIAASERLNSRLGMQ